MKEEHYANLPRTGHDLSHNFDYTSPVGSVIPVFTQLVNPGETISLKIDPSGSRTQPLSQSAYIDMNIHEEYFFVPMSCLFTKFADFIYQVSNTYSSSIDDLLSSVDLPLLDLYKLHKSIYDNPNLPSFGSLAFDSYAKGMIRLLDNFGMLLPVEESSNYFNEDEAPSVAFWPKVFPYKLLAYNCIYQYFFRNEEREKFDPTMFNVDKYTSSEEIPFNLPNVTSGLRFRMFYRPISDDYFTEMTNSPLVTVTNVLGQPGNLPLASSYLTRGSRGSASIINQTQSRGQGTPQINPGNPDNVNTGFGLSFINDRYNGFPVDTPLNGLDINTANFRAMFANEKFWRITGMADKTYDAQTLAHYGFKVPVDVMHQPQRIGHDIYPLRIGEVISTSSAEGQPLGTVAGKGYVTDGKSRGCKFTAPCHGVVIALQSISFPVSYITPFLRDSAIASWQDFYQAEFDHLGKQPLYSYETIEKVPETIPYVIGWQYRYEQFKRKFHRASQAFLGAQPWENQDLGPFAEWNVSGNPFSGTLGTNTGLPTDYYYFYLSPLYTNKIFTISYDTNDAPTDSNDGYSWLSRPSDVYATDPIVFHTRIESKLVSTMSKYSQPRLSD